MAASRWISPKRSILIRPLLMLGAAAALAILSGTACSLYTQDRCFLPDDEYSLAHDLFVQTGSLDIVKKSLTDKEWEDCKINEALYRLQKEFQVLPEGSAAQAKPSPAGLTIPVPKASATPAPAK